MPTSPNHLTHDERSAGTFGTRSFFGNYSRTELQETGLPDWTDGYDLAEWIEENGYDYDGILLDEGAEFDANGNVIERGVSYVVRSSEQIKNADNQNPTSNPDIRFSMKTPSEDDAYSTEGIRWVYDLDVVYKKDLARFWEAVANLDRRGYYYPRSKNGLYIIESGNKMFFTDGDYRNPSVESVIWFDDAFETNLAELKEWIYNEERTFGRHDESLGLIEDVCGYGYVREFRKEVYRSHERETERRKGENRKGHTGGSEGGERYSLKGSDDYNLQKLQVAHGRYGFVP